MTLSPEFESLSHALAQAWRDVSTTALPPMQASPQSRDEAFAIQSRMFDLLDDPCVGWKIGAPVRAVQILEGHDGPIIGRIPASRLQSSPGTLPARFKGYKIESEFAFRFARAVPARPGGYTREEIDPIISLHPGLELAGSRYAITHDSRRFTTYDAIADNGTAGGYILGEAVSSWRGIDLAGLILEARIDGGEPIEVYQGIYRRDPVDILVETVNSLGERGIGMAEGDIFTTGSLTMPTPLHPGQTYVANFPGLGSVSVTMERP
jgi:2-keto-4-pentenoate hydratase